MSRESAPLLDRAIKRLRVRDHSTPELQQALSVRDAATMRQALMRGVELGLVERMPNTGKTARWKLSAPKLNASSEMSSAP